MTEIEFSEPLPDRLEALADSLRGEWPPHTLGDLQEAAYLLRKHGLQSLRSGNGGEVRAVTDDMRSFLYAVLGADTWLEAGAIWEQNPEHRMAAHAFFGSAAKGGVR